MKQQILQSIQKQEVMYDLYEMSMRESLAYLQQKQAKNKTKQKGNRK